MQFRPISPIVPLIGQGFACQCDSKGAIIVAMWLEAEGVVTYVQEEVAEKIQALDPHPTIRRDSQEIESRGCSKGPDFSRVGLEIERNGTFAF